MKEKNSVFSVIKKYGTKSVKTTFRILAGIGGSILVKNTVVLVNDNLQDAYDQQIKNNKRKR